MADQSSSSSVIQAMDRIWFNQNIMNKMPISSETPPTSPSSSAVTEDNCIKSEMASTSNPTHQPKERERSPRPTPDIVNKHHFPLQPITSEIPFCHSPPQVRKHPRRRLAQMRSYKSFSELEHEELKGFTDLGFKFNEEEMSPYMKSMLPGLQMLDEKQVLTRPYLSEAWFIKRPDSPLLNLQIPPISAASGAEIKKQLRFWARTVANVIHQES